MNGFNTLNPYNGWTNNPTWLVYTWLSNDETTDELCREIVTAATSDIQADDKIRELVEEATDDQTSGLHTDLMRFTLAYVNWAEITNAYQATVAEEAEVSG